MAIIKKSPAQILIMTLIVLLLVSLTVVVITVTVAKNNRQVFNNIEYERSYNLAETRMLQVVPILSDPQFDIFSLLSLDSQREIGATSCELIPSKVDEYYCSFSEAGNETKTLMRMSESNTVNAYDLPADQYFDIILSSGSSSADFRDEISLQWVGSSALELTLISRDSSGVLRQHTDIVDYTFGTEKVYSNSGKTSSGFTQSPLEVTNNVVNVDLSRLDSTKIPNSDQLLYLRVKAVNRNAGTVISIKPIDNDSLPNQVRLLEAFNYRLNTADSAVPVITTQLPLSPPTPSPLSKAGAYHSLRTPICGNNIIEGGEFCDDGNTTNLDGCPNDCGCIDLKEYASQTSVSGGVMSIADFRIIAVSGQIQKVFAGETPARYVDSCPASQPCSCIDDPDCDYIDTGASTSNNCAPVYGAITDIASEHEYEVHFDNPRRSARLNIVDMGDWNPRGHIYHKVEVIALDAGGNTVDSYVDEWRQVAGGIRLDSDGNIYTGGACKDPAGGRGPGNLEVTVSTSGFANIRKLDINFYSKPTATSAWVKGPSDRNIAIGGFCW